MMSDYILATVTAVWLGFLCSVSPCPLTTNIAAISFVSRNVGNVGVALSAGVLYTLGRTITYAVLGSLLISGFSAAPEISHLLQKYMNLLMGPCLILVAIVLLDMLKLPISSRSGMGEEMQRKVEKAGVFGAFLLGILFALSFCPTSAALFFGSLLPLAVRMESRFVLPGIFGIGTGLPVLLFAFLLAFSANKVGQAYNKLAKFESWAQRITGGIFLLAGIVMTLNLTIGIRLW